MLKYLTVVALLLAFAPGQGMAETITVHTTDFINDAYRDGFAGFEPLGQGLYPNPDPWGKYYEGGFRVDQCDFSGTVLVDFQAWGGVGENSWTGNSALGWTRIWGDPLGYDLGNIGFLVGTVLPTTIYYQVYHIVNHSDARLEGSITTNGGAQYLGFSGEGLRGVYLSNAPGFNGSTLSVDNIERAYSLPPQSFVPEPSSLVLLSTLGVMSLLVARRRKRAE